MDMVVWMGQVTSGVKSRYCKVVGHQAGTELSDRPGVPRPLLPV